MKGNIMSEATLKLENAQLKYEILQLRSQLIQAAAAALEPELVAAMEAVKAEEAAATPDAKDVVAKAMGVPVESVIVEGVSST
jgi:hypothetical protein